MNQTTVSWRQLLRGSKDYFCIVTADRAFDFIPENVDDNDLGKPKCLVVYTL